MLTLENKNYFGNQGQGYLLTAIASVLIGGTSIFGGRATIIGTVFGCFIIGMIEAGLVATGLTGAWVRTIQGLVFLVAIIFYLYVDEPQQRGAPSSRASGRREGSAPQLRPDRSRLPRGKPETESSGRNSMRIDTALDRRRGAALAAGLAGGAAGAGDARRRARHVHADGRQPRRRRHARPPDRRRAGRRRRSASQLNEQFSAWAPETMINQFKEAVAAQPDCIEIMGHPGSAAFHDLVKQAVDQGIVVTVGNSPMTDLQSDSARRARAMPASTSTRAAS